MQRLCAALLWFIGGLSIANSLWMLAAPRHWFYHIPADVPAIGPFNSHFIQDIGCAYLAAGLALMWGAAQPASRRLLVTIAAVFYGGHALVHVWGTAAGDLPASHWLIDFPSVYLPALILACIAAIP